MKKVIPGIFALFLSLGLFAQTPINLNLHPMVGNTPFQLDSVYPAYGDQNFNLNSVRYYISGIQLVHDGGQTTVLQDVYLLVNANTTQYYLTDTNVTNIEGIVMHIGVDPNVNHNDPNLWPASHPLAPQSPTMHWGWNAGYRFIAFNGETDTNADLVPEDVFEIHTVGDQLLRQVSLNLSATMNQGALEMDVYYDLKEWLRDIDLSNTGITHGPAGAAEELSDNVITFPVFRTDQVVGFAEENRAEHSMYFNYVEMNRPVVYYKSEGMEKIGLRVFDMTGKVVWEASNLEPEGKVRINSQLSAGMYVCQMIENNEPVHKKKFHVFK